MGYKKIFPLSCKLFCGARMSIAFNHMQLSLQLMLTHRHAQCNMISGIVLS